MQEKLIFFRNIFSQRKTIFFLIFSFFLLAVFLISHQQLPQKINQFLNNKIFIENTALASPACNPDACAVYGTICCPGIESCIVWWEDENNCGRCGNRCPPGSTCRLNVPGDRTRGASCQGCDAAACGTYGLICCQGIVGCVNPWTDRNNCGGCGIRCGTGYRCSSGQCVDGTPPAISITNPQNGATVSGTVEIRADVADPQSQVEWVKFAVRKRPTGTATVICTDNSFPYSCSWNTTAFENGSYSVIAWARSAGGEATRSIGVTVSNIGPGPVCGNRVCESGENTSNCPADCPSVCNPQTCQAYGAICCPGITSCVRWWEDEQNCGACGNICPAGTECRLNVPGNYTRGASCQPTTTTRNQPPNTPSKPSGPTSGQVNTNYTYSTSTTDPNGDQIKYGWDWDGDGTVDEWSGLMNSGAQDSRSHLWSTARTYYVKVKAKDSKGAESGWSLPLRVTILGQAARDLRITSQSCEGNKVKVTFEWNRAEDNPARGLIIGAQFLDLSVLNNNFLPGTFLQTSNPPSPADIFYTTGTGQIGNLDPGKTHYWRINTQYTTGIWHSSGTATFTTDSCAQPGENLPTAALNSLSPHKLNPVEVDRLTGAIPLPNGRYLPEQYKIRPAHPGHSGRWASCPDLCGTCWGAKGLKGSADGLPEGLAVAWVTCYSPAEGFLAKPSPCGGMMAPEQTVATDRNIFPCNAKITVPGFIPDAPSKDTGCIAYHWIDVFKNTCDGWDTYWYLIGYK